MELTAGIQPDLTSAILSHNSHDVPKNHPGLVFFLQFPGIP